MSNKEYGSDFHFFPVSDQKSFIGGHDILYFFSGRSALSHILKAGIEKYGWTKFFIPTYYCREVYEFISDLPIELVYYPYNPFFPPKGFDIEDLPTNVLLKVNYFGIASPEFSGFSCASVIEDLTHEPETSPAIYSRFVFGSLRKVLPVPAGGFIKSKEIVMNATPVSVAAQEVAAQKMAAMFLKKRYLEGTFDDKDLFRKLFIEAENRFAEPETNTLLPDFVTPLVSKTDLNGILEAKATNNRLISTLLKENDIFSLVTKSIPSAYACILFFKNTDQRNALREHLVKNKIYPMILWPNQLTALNAETESKILFIHTDFRYSLDDMKYIAETINQFIEKNG